MSKNPPMMRTTSQYDPKVKGRKSKLGRLSRSSRSVDAIPETPTPSPKSSNPFGFADMDIFYYRQLAVNLQDQQLQQKIDHEIRMRDGTAKLLAASKHPHQMLEAAKNLHASNARMLAFMSQLQKCKADAILKNSQSADGNQTPCKAKVSLSGLRIPLMWKDADHFKSKGDHRRYAVFCLVKIGTEIMDTQLLGGVDRSMTDVAFNDILTFSDVGPDFECQIEVYCHRSQDDLSVVSTPKRIKKKIEDFGTSVGRTVGRRLSGFKEDADPVNSMLIGPKFECIGSGSLRLCDVSEDMGTFSLKLETETSGLEIPLFGNFCCRVVAQPYCLVQNILSGPLAVQDKETLKWHSFWCSLRNLALRFWQYESEMDNSPPCLTVPVTKTSLVSEVPASLCQRSYCIQITSQTGRQRTSWNMAAADVEDKTKWWDAIYQHLLDQVMWLQACDKVMEIRSTTVSKRHSAYQLRGSVPSLYEETEVTEATSPMTRMLNRLNIPEDSPEKEGGKSKSDPPSTPTTTIASSSTPSPPQTRLPRKVEAKKAQKPAPLNLLPQNSMLQNISEDSKENKLPADSASKTRTQKADIQSEYAVPVGCLPEPTESLRRTENYVETDYAVPVGYVSVHGDAVPVIRNVKTADLLPVIRNVKPADSVPVICDAEPADAIPMENKPERPDAASLHTEAVLESCADDEMDASSAGSPSPVPSPVTHFRDVFQIEILTESPSVRKSRDAAEDEEDEAADKQDSSGEAVEDQPCPHEGSSVLVPRDPNTSSAKLPPLPSSDRSIMSMDQLSDESESVTDPCGEEESGAESSDEESQPEEDPEEVPCLKSSESQEPELSEESEVSEVESTEGTQSPASETAAGEDMQCSKESGIEHLSETTTDVETTFPNKIVQSENTDNVTSEQTIEPSSTSTESNIINANISVDSEAECATKTSEAPRLEESAQAETSSNSTDKTSLGTSSTDTTSSDPNLPQRQESAGESDVVKSDDDPVPASSDQESVPQADLAPPETSAKLQSEISHDPQTPTTAVEVCEGKSAERERTFDQEASSDPQPTSEQEILSADGNTTQVETSSQESSSDIKQGECAFTKQETDEEVSTKDLVNTGKVEDLNPDSQPVLNQESKVDVKVPSDEPTGTRSISPENSAVDDITTDSDSTLMPVSSESNQNPQTLSEITQKTLQEMVQSYVPKPLVTDMVHNQEQSSSIGELHKDRSTLPDNEHSNNDVTPSDSELRTSENISDSVTLVKPDLPSSSNEESEGSILGSKEVPDDSCSVKKCELNNGKQEESCEESAVELNNQADHCASSPSVDNNLHPTEIGESNPTENADSNPTENADFNPTKKADSNPTEKVNSNPTENAESNPTDNIDTNPAEKVNSNPTESVASNPTENVSSNPTEKVNSNPTESVASNPTENVSSNPTEKVNSNPTESVASNPTENVDSNPAEKVNSNTTESADSNLTDNVDTNPAENIITNPTESADSNTTDITESEPTENGDSDPEPENNKPKIVRKLSQETSV